jgi:hypothetical protein
MNLTTTKRPKRKFNREFQKNEVIKYLIMKDQNFVVIDKPIVVPQSLFNPPYGEESYLSFVYKVKDQKEYMEGFGPSVYIRIDNEDTTWKRSRNKWNSFDKIRTTNQINNDNFDILWDQSGLNSYYVLERMYYYLDKEKHKNKFNSIRAKLYITRVHQHGDWIFLLQFITEHLTLEEQESNRRMKQKRKKSISNTSIDVVDDSVKNMYYPPEVQVQVSNNMGLQNKMNNTMNNNTINNITKSTTYSPSLTDSQGNNDSVVVNEQTSINLPFQQFFNIYMKDKLFTGTYNNPMLNTSSIYVKPDIREEISTSPLKRKIREFDIDNQPLKKKKREDKPLHGNVIEDQEILKTWFGFTNDTKVNKDIKSIPKNIVDLLN